MLAVGASLGSLDRRIQSNRGWRQRLTWTSVFWNNLIITQRLLIRISVSDFRTVPSGCWSRRAQPTFVSASEEVRVRVWALVFYRSLLAAGLGEPSLHCCRFSASLKRKTSSMSPRRRPPSVARWRQPRERQSQPHPSPQRGRPWSRPERCRLLIWFDEFPWRLQSVADR